MQRPQSIVNFERCYLGSVALGLIATALNWSHMQSLVAVQQSTAMVGRWYAPTLIVVSLIINLLLWYFAARRGSVVAKWIVVVLFAFACLGIVTGFAMHTNPPGIAGVISVVVFVLEAIAVWLLFKPDAKAWFGEPAPATDVLD
jgi:drug/metabolite transporter (DMT)-like permease